MRVASSNGIHKSALRDPFRIWEEHTVYMKWRKQAVGVEVGGYLDNLIHYIYQHSVQTTGIADEEMIQRIMNDPQAKADLMSPGLVKKLRTENNIIDYILRQHHDWVRVGNPAVEIDFGTGASEWVRKQKVVPSIKAEPKKQIDLWRAIPVRPRHRRLP